MWGTIMLYRRERSSREKGTGPCAAGGWEEAGWLLCSMRAAASTVQRAGWREDGKAVPREKKLQSGGAQQDVSTGNGGSVLCVKAKVREAWPVYGHTVLGEKLC